MTINTDEDGELPEPIEELNKSYRPLIVDSHYRGEHILRDIVDIMDLPITVDGNNLDHIDMAVLYKAITDDEDRMPRIVRRFVPKKDMICDLGDHFGFSYAEDQSVLRKSQQIHILLELVSDEPVRQFSLPSDPDTTDDTNRRETEDYGKQVLQA